MERVGGGLGGTGAVWCRWSSAEAAVGVAVLVLIEGVEEVLEFSLGFGFWVSDEAGVVVVFEEDAVEGVEVVVVSALG